MANILSITSINNPNALKVYLDYLSADLQPHEINDLRVMCECFASLNPPANLFDGYNVGYKIPQISREFDLLRVGDNKIINIEIKSEFSHDKVLKQLTRNRYYLAALKLKSHLFTFVSDTRTFYKLSEAGDAIEEAALIDVLRSLHAQKKMYTKNLDSLFNPSDYLVSPFNSTDRFIENEYFLTNQQEYIKNTVLKKFSESFSNIISIEGKAGTGKTLLLYDIAKTLMYVNKKVLIIHVGKLNEGHRALRSDHGFNIIPVKDILATLRNQSGPKYECVIIDEAQRINSAQLSEAFSLLKSAGINCIFGFDRLQVLSAGELTSSTMSLISAKETEHHTLTEKIRTNHEVSQFIKALFELRYKSNSQMDNVSAVHFPDYMSASNYIKFKTEYDFIAYTPSTKLHFRHEIDSLQELGNRVDNAHGAVGQEFDSVIVVIDYIFYYDSEGTLRCHQRDNVPYDQLKMLFQIVTRTRNKLEVVVVNNEPVFKEIINILKGSKFKIV